MKEHYLIGNQSVHLWHVVLNEFFDKEAYYLSLLNSEELARANRFHFPIHRQRFIIARAMLREILSLYTHIPPQDIIFAYAHRGKPYLANNPLNLQFNVSHSENLAVYALTIRYEIGVDIQKIEKGDREPIAKRFFSPNEYLEIAQLKPDKQKIAFYRLWACKEAIIKALGEGLYLSLTDFDVTLNKKTQWVSFRRSDLTEAFFLKTFRVRPNYQFAFASNQEVTDIAYFNWSLKGPLRVGPQFV